MTTTNQSSGGRWRTPFVLLGFFALLLAAGVTAGEPGRVLAQAVQICLSCIGIG